MRYPDWMSLLQRRFGILFSASARNGARLLQDLAYKAIYVTHEVDS
jgi:hypothetical protein